MLVKMLVLRGMVLFAKLIAVRAGAAEAFGSAPRARFEGLSRSRVTRRMKFAKICRFFMKCRLFLNFQQNFRVLGQAGLPRRLAPKIAHSLGAATARKGA